GHERRSEYLPETAAGELSRRAASEHLTAYGFVQAIWGLLLSRYSGEPDVLFGSIASGRPEALAGVESMIGLFINTLPVRLQVDPAKRFIDWVRTIHRQQIEARKHGYASLVEIQGWSDLPRGEPLFESILGYQSFASRELKASSNGSGFEAVSAPDELY